MKEERGSNTRKKFVSIIYQSNRIKSELQPQPGPGYNHAHPLKGIHQCLMEVKEDSNKNKETNHRIPQTQSMHEIKGREGLGNFDSENE